MTPDVETIEEGAELSEAVDRMIRRRIKRLPVLRGETVVGVISRSDLLKGLLAGTPRAKGPHPDAEIKAAIQAELDKLDWAPRASVRIEVAGGVVSTARSPTNGFATASRSSPRIRPAALDFAVHDHMAWIEPNSGYFMASPEDEERKQ